jgi:hypothetical protein
MGHFKFSRVRKWLAPPHPTWQSKKSRNRAFQFLNKEKVRSPRGQRLNIGSGSRRLDTETLNLDLLACEEVDIQGDLLHLPIKDEVVETVVCTGVLEHVSASALAWQFQETMAMLFSLNNKALYKIGLRIFGWLAVPLSWLDIMLERNPMAWHAASGYALTAVKRQRPDGKE